MPWLTPASNAPVGTVCRTLQIPNDLEYIRSVTGALLELTYPDNWEQFGAATPDEVAAVFQTMLSTYLDVPCMYPKSAHLFHHQALPLVGGSPLISTGSTLATIRDQAYGHVANQQPYSSSDQFKQEVFLDAGTYTFAVLGTHNNVHGKVDWYLDNVLIVSGQDWYGATLALNIIKTATVTVATGGQHTLKGVINGKNASSTNYALALTAYWFRPNA